MRDRPRPRSAGLILLGATLLGACSGEGGSLPSLAPSASPSYEIADVRVQEISDPVPGVYWVLTYDAEWKGSSTPVPLRCVWKMRNKAGDPILQGGVTIEALHGRDLVAADVYPDEIPGRPVTGEIDC